MEKFQTVKGMRDLLPEDFLVFKHVIKVIRQLFYLYNYQELSMPILEPYELLAAKSGEEIKESMYVFEDKGGRKLVLRPEMTASIARVYITHFMLAAKKPLRLAYIGPCYRYDNPQYGRYREFRQAGFEIIGSSYPEADAEILSICNDLMTYLEFKNYSFKVGHVGILRSILEQEGLGEEVQNKVFSLIDRNKTDEAFKLLRNHELKEDCIKIIKSLMKLKGGDIYGMIEGATLLLSPYDKARDALQNLREILELYLSSGEPGRLEIDLGFARGLEYYTGMIFEIFIPDISVAVGGGGRYDKLIENFNGKSTPAVGCAPGIDRIVLAMKEKKIFKSNEENLLNRIMIVFIDEQMLSKSLEIAHILRKNNFPVEFDIGRKKLKKAITFAIDKKIRYMIICGPDEIIKNELAVRDLATNEQVVVPIENIVGHFIKNIENR